MQSKDSSKSKTNVSTKNTMNLEKAANPCQSVLKSARNIFNTIFRGCSEGSIQPKARESEETMNKSGSSSRVAPVTSNNMVYLNVYSLTQVNQVISYTGLGIYHSGVEVYGHEWAYGGYPDPICSIFRMKQPKDISSLSDISGRFHFYQSIEMGLTKYSFREVEMILVNLGRAEWIGTKYHLLNHNCNCFANELCKILVGKSIPSWVNRPATVFSRVPWHAFLMVPDEYITPVALIRQAQRDSNKKSDKVRAEINKMRERQRKTIKMDLESASKNCKSAPRSANKSAWMVERSKVKIEPPTNDLPSIRTDPNFLEISNSKKIIKVILSREQEKTLPTMPKKNGVFEVQSEILKKTLPHEAKTEDSPMSKYKLEKTLRSETKTVNSSRSKFKLEKTLRSETKTGESLMSKFKLEKTLPRGERSGSDESVISKTSDESLR